MSFCSILLGSVHFCSFHFPGERSSSRARYCSGAGSHREQQCKYCVLFKRHEEMQICQQKSFQEASGELFFHHIIWQNDEGLIFGAGEVPGVRQGWPLPGSCLISFRLPSFVFLSSPLSSSSWSHCLDIRGVVELAFCVFRRLSACLSTSLSLPCHKATRRTPFHFTFCPSLLLARCLSSPPTTTGLSPLPSLATPAVVIVTLPSVSLRSFSHPPTCVSSIGLSSSMSLKVSLFSPLSRDPN